MTVVVLISVVSGTAPAYAAADRIVEYQAHVQNLGWMGIVADDSIAGTTGQNRHLEAFRIKVPSEARQICYDAQVQNRGWLGRLCGAPNQWHQIGTTGQNLQLEAFWITIGNDAARIYYDAHLENVGWQGYRMNGGIAGTVGQNRQIEAVRIEMIF